MVATVAAPDYTEDTRLLELPIPEESYVPVVGLHIAVHGGYSTVAPRGQLSLTAAALRVAELSPAKDLEADEGSGDCCPSCSSS